MHNFNKWKNSMSPNQIRVYEAIAGNLLHRLGYERKCLNAKLSPYEVIYYKSIETPLRIKKYLFDILNPATRNSVIRRIKLKIKDLR